jgi:hypothetical protein
LKKKTRLCSLDGCEKKHVAKGYCWKHYERNRKYGDPLASKTAGDGEPKDFLHRCKIANVDTCIIWPFGRQKDGYGALRFRGKMVLAHRASLIIAKGLPPKDKPFACHSPLVCHNRLCVNPNHLRWASQEENEADKKIDGTALAKISEADAVAIKGMILEGMTNVSIAKQFDVSSTTISKIRRGKIWGDVEVADFPRPAPTQEAL